MSDVNGNVEAVGSIQKKNGLIYTVTVDGGVYEYGMKAPRFKPGDPIEFDVEEKYGTQRIKFGTLNYGDRVGTGGSAPAARPASAPRNNAPARIPAPPARVFPVPLLHETRPIIRQNALAHATALVVAEMMKSKGGKADLSACADEVINLAKMFEAYAAGDDERLKEQAKAAAKAAAGAGDDE